MPNQPSQGRSTSQAINTHGGPDDNGGNSNDDDADHGKGAGEPIGSQDGVRGAGTPGGRLPAHAEAAEGGIHGRGRSRATNGHGGGVLRRA